MLSSDQDEIISKKKFLTSLKNLLVLNEMYKRDYCTHTQFVSILIINNTCFIYMYVVVAYFVCSLSKLILLQNVDLVTLKIISKQNNDNFEMGQKCLPLVK